VLQLKHKKYIGDSLELDSWFEWHLRVVSMVADMGKDTLGVSNRPRSVCLANGLADCSWQTTSDVEQESLEPDVIDI
jgi:hypothetical protein